MPVRKIQGNQRKKKGVERYKNRVPLPAMIDKKQQDILIIDKALESLYNDGDKVIRSLHTDVLKAHKLNLNEKEVERIWDLMVNTGLVHAVIGFGNAGKLDLTNEGYQLMSQFGSYSGFLQEHQRQLAQQNQGVNFPQFIIEQAQEAAGEKVKDASSNDKAVEKRTDEFLKFIKMTETTTAPVTFTEGALKEIKLLQEQPDMGQDMFLRVGVKGGGCSGLSYVLGFDKKEEDDIEAEVQGVTVIMKKAHGMYLVGMEIDYANGLNARGFIFNNPNASSSCGCGTSFAV